MEQSIFQDLALINSCLFSPCWIKHFFLIRPKKKNCYVALTRPKFENWVGRSIFFFFFLRTVRELSFPIFFLKFLNGENSGGMQSKRIYTSAFLGH